MKKIYLIAAAALALAACDNNNDDTPVPSSVAAQITATIGESVTSRAGGTHWDADDRIGITAVIGVTPEPFVNMRYTTAAGDGAFSGEPIYIYNPMTLTAYYPFYEEISAETTTIETSTEAAKQTADDQPSFDFLYAKKEGITTDNITVNLQFAHMMSKLTFIFTDGDGTDVSKLTSYTVEGLVLKGTFDTAAGTCSAKSGVAAQEITMDVTGKVTSGALLPSLIIFPQDIAAEKNVSLRITDSEDQRYVCDLGFSGKSFEAGKNYQFNVTVNKPGLNIDKIEIKGWETSEKSIDATIE